VALESKCPKCAASFDTARNRSYPSIAQELVVGSPKSPEQRIAEASRVKCPSCGFEFPSESVRFFGILGPRGMNRLMLAFVFGVVVAVAIMLIGTFRA
jgi:endogenous inhibitor of DNA gyrase (YacG/DUF329 family)